ncbi:MAG: hypothetical protein ACI957_005508, partial [Verrucomicrobiales bacterium]
MLFLFNNLQNSYRGLSGKILTVSSRYVIFFLIISDLGYSYSRKHDYVRVYGISHFGVLSYT